MRSINFGRPELMKSAMIGSSPQLAEMPKKAKTELLVEEEEAPSPRRLPPDLGEIEGVVGRERWLPSFYADMLKKSSRSTNNDDTPASP